jgi:hypothetical protein
VRISHERHAGHAGATGHRKGRRAAATIRHTGQNSPSAPRGATGATGASACGILRKRGPGRGLLRPPAITAAQQAWLETQLQKLHPGCAITITISPPSGGPAEAALPPPLTDPAPASSRSRRQPRDPVHPPDKPAHRPALATTPARARCPHAQPGPISVSECAGCHNHMFHTSPTWSDMGERYRYGSSSWPTLRAGGRSPGQHPRYTAGPRGAAASRGPRGPPGPSGRAILR